MLKRNRQEDAKNKAKYAIESRRDVIRYTSLESKLNIVRSGLRNAYTSNKLNEQIEGLTEYLLLDLKDSKNDTVYNNIII